MSDQERQEDSRAFEADDAEVEGHGLRGMSEGEQPDVEGSGLSGTSEDDEPEVEGHGLRATSEDKSESKAYGIPSQ